MVLSSSSELQWTKNSVEREELLNTMRKKATYFMHSLAC